MKNRMLSKTLAVAVIILFIGVGIQPAIAMTKEGNSPPYTPTQIPPDGSICGLLEWYGGDPDGDNVTYDIYFGKYDPFDPYNPPKIATIGPYPGNQTHVYYQLEGLLNFETEYVWKIIAWDEYGLNNSSEIWLFETEQNYPPNSAIPLIPDGATDVPVDVIICWNGSDPNKCEILMYSLFFGLYDPPTQQTINQTWNCYDPYGPDGDLPLYETFYWKVVTCDGTGECTSSKVWTFTTGINPPPRDPDIDVPSRWPAGVELCLNISSTDPCNQTIMYIIDWGDGTINETNFYESGALIEICHTYEEKGTYIIIIRVKAIDVYGAESNWSEFEITIPRTRASSYLWYEWLLARFPLLEKLLSFLLL